MSYALRIELLSLVTLSRHMRVAERKAFDHAQLLRIHTRLSTAGIPKQKMHRILKRATSRTIRLIGANKMLSENGKDILVPMQIPEKEWIESADKTADEIHIDRTVYLRRDLRTLHLAYSFLRGIEFSKIEKKGREPIPFDRIEAVVNKYAIGDKRQVAQRFGAWKHAAGGNHPIVTHSPRKTELRQKADEFHSRLHLAL